MQKVKSDELGLYVVGGVGRYRPTMTDDAKYLQSYIELATSRHRSQPLGTTKFRMGDKVSENEATHGSFAMLTTNVMSIWTPGDKSTLEVWFCKIKSSR